MIEFLYKNMRLQKLFERFLKYEKEKTYPYNTNYYNSRGVYDNTYFCYEKELKETKEIVFYEWSTLNGTQRHFKCLKDFYDFIKESKITFPSFEIRRKIVSSPIIYSTCEKNCSNLIVSETKEELNDLLNGTKK